MPAPSAKSSSPPKSFSVSPSKLKVGDEQLQLLPGVGEKRAAAIVEIRKNKGGFKAVEELTDVKGVGDALIERLRPHLTVSGKTTAQRL